MSRYHDTLMAIIGEGDQTFLGHIEPFLDGVLNSFMPSLNFSCGGDIYMSSDGEPYMDYQLRGYILDNCLFEMLNLDLDAQDVAGLDRVLARAIEHKYTLGRMFGHFDSPSTENWEEREDEDEDEVSTDSLIQQARLEQAILEQARDMARVEATVFSGTTDRPISVSESVVFREDDGCVGPTGVTGPFGWTYTREEEPPSELKQIADRYEEDSLINLI